MTGFVNTSCRPGVAALVGLALSFGLTPAFAQGNHPWIDQSLLAAAKAEGSLIVYSSTNEGEGLPLFKIFEDATGIKVQYVRGADAPLLVAHGDRVPRRAEGLGHRARSRRSTRSRRRCMAQIDPPEAKNILPEARDPGKRWYGVYANYNSPAYNTQKVKASELPKSYEDFAKHKEWAGKVAIDGTDNEWLMALLSALTASRRASRSRKDIVANAQADR